MRYCHQVLIRPGLVGATERPAAAQHAALQRLQRDVQRQNGQQAPVDCDVVLEPIPGEIEQHIMQQ